MKHNITAHDKETFIYGAVIVLVLIFATAISLSSNLQALFIPPAGPADNHVPVVTTFDVSCEEIHVVVEDSDITDRKQYRTTVYVDTKEQDTIMRSVKNNDLTINDSNTGFPIPTNGIHNIVVMTRDLDADGNTAAWISGFSNDSQTTYAHSFEKSFDFGSCGQTTNMFGGDANIVYSGNLTCDPIYCNDIEPCTCEENENMQGGAEPDFFQDEDSNITPINQQLKLLEHKILFEDPIGYGCNYVQGRSEEGDHLFGAISISIDGKTLYTTEYMGGSFFELDDTRMNVSVEDSRHFLNEWSVTGDCGSARTVGSFLYANGDYGVEKNLNGYDTVLHRTGNEFKRLIEFRQGPTAEPYNQSGYTDGYVLRSDGSGKRYGHYFVGKNGVRYGLLGTIGTSGPGNYQNLLDTEIHDITDVTNPIYIKNIEQGSGLYKALSETNALTTTGHFGKVWTSRSALPYITVAVENGSQVEIYDLTNPAEEALLATVPKIDGIIEENTWIVRVYDTLYVTDNRNKIFKYQVGIDSGFTEAVQIHNGNVSTLHPSLLWFTNDHMLFYKDGQQKITVYNLKTGKNVLHKAQLPETFAGFGYTMSMPPTDNIDWVVGRHDDAYYLYTIGSGKVEGGPNIITATKIGRTTEGNFVNHTCTPSCAENNYCGQNDGCGYQCTPHSTKGAGSTCGSELLRCRPSDWGSHGLLTGNVSCVCMDDDMNTCTPGTSYCEYERGGNRTCNSGTGPYFKYTYTCEGPSESCSRYRDKTEIVCSEPTNCTNLDKNF